MIPWIIAHQEGLLLAANALLTLLLAVAALTPTQTDDNVIGRIKNIFHALTGR